MKNFTRVFLAMLVVLTVDFSAYSQQVFKVANVGVGVINPTQKLDVAGSIQFTKALMPNSLPGSAGNILLSSGIGVAPTWLANGTTGQVLTIAGGVPTWSTPATSVTSIGVTAPIVNTGTPTAPIIGIQGTTADQGSILYSTGLGTSAAFLSTGTATYLLQSNGTGAPSWLSPTALAAEILPAGTNTQTLYYNGTVLTATSSLTNDGKGDVVITQAAQTATPMATALTVTGGVLTTASPLEPDVYINLARQITMSNGPGVNPLRGMYITAPQIGVSLGIIPPLTTASTVDISGAPTAFGTYSITNAYALNVETGSVAIGSLANAASNNVAPNALGGAIVYATTGGKLNSIPKVNNAILVTSATGVPSWSTTATSGTDWVLTGNSGVTYAANFLGTVSGTDQSLKFEVNGVTAGRIEDINTANGGYGNTSSGNLALSTAATAYSNTAIGKEALRNSTISQSVAVGDSAMAGNTTATGNTAVGYQALANNQTVNNNTALGYQAMQTKTGGTNSVAVGYQAMQASNSGNSVAVGELALANSAAGFNIGIGVSALQNNTGASNTGVGASTLLNNTGNFNTTVGSTSLNGNTSGTNNAAFGYQALQGNTTGTFNTALGSNANVASSGLTNATAIGANAIAPVSNSVTLGNAAATSLYLPGYATVGSMFYTSAATGLVSPIAIGSTGQVLTIAGGVPTWSTPATSVTSIGVTAPIVNTGTPTAPIIGIQGTTADQGSILYSTGLGTSAAFLSTGTATYLLQSNGTGAPSWLSPTALAAEILPAGTNTQTLYYNGTVLTATSSLTNDGKGDVVITQAAQTATPMATALTVTGGVLTTASPLEPDVYINLARQITMSNGPGVNPLRGMYITAPQIGVSLGIIPPLTTASTVDISGAPTAFGTYSITNAYALNVETGSVAIGSLANAASNNVAPNALGGAIVYATTGGKLNSIPKVNNAILVTSATGVPSWSTTATSGTDWVLTGNSGVTYAANFLGTVSGTDQSLKFEVNGVTAGRIEDINTANGGYGNTSSGNLALSTAATAYSNTAIGKEALRNSTISQSVAVGDSAMAGNTTATGNTAVGYQALANNQTVNNNTALGYQAMQTKTGGTNSVAVGYQAMQASNSGNSVAVGELALANSAAGFNIGIGVSALQNNTGASNTGVGASTLLNNTGNFNTTVGSTSLNGNTSGTNNAAFGYQALQGNTTGTFNTALGSNANVASSGLTNATAIGANAIAPVSNSVTLGSSAVTSLYLPGYNNVGSIFYTSAGTGLVSALAPGSNGNVLTLAGGVPIWAVGGTVTSISATAPLSVTNPTSTPNILLSGTAGGVLYGTGGGVGSAFTSAGSAGYVLQSNGSGAPTWVASAPNDWSINGNSGTTAGTNFIGTTDANDLVFKTNGTEDMRISSSNGYLGIGTNSPGNPISVFQRSDADKYLITADAEQLTTGPDLQNVAIYGYAKGGNNAHGYALGVMGIINPNSHGGAAVYGGFNTSAPTLASANSFYGIYTDASGIVGIQTGYAAAFMNGNVGIGTNTPAHALDIVGDISFTNALMPGGLAGTTGNILLSSGGGAPTWLANGTTGEVLTIVGGIPTWSASSSGTVTSFSAGNLSPLFTTSVATATSTPALTFALSNVAAHTFFGNFTGSTAAPTFGSPALASADFANQGTATTILHGNAGGNPSWAAVNLTNEVTGVTGVTNGGTGLSTVGANGTVLTVSGGIATWAAPASSGWALTGNLGTAYSTNFIGTTDDQGLRLKVNGHVAGRIEDGTSANGSYFNTSIGYDALKNTTTGVNNTALGYNALIGTGTSTTVTDNTAVGYLALESNTTGSFNTALGDQALDGNTTGSHNLAVGYLAMNSAQWGQPSTGTYNIGIGENAVDFISSGSENIGIGQQTLYNNDAGSFNIAIGDFALNASNGDNSVAIGYNALNSGVNVSDVAIGTNANSGSLNSGTFGNVAIGFEANKNIAGTGSTSSSGGGNANTAIGYRAMLGTPIGNFASSGNTAIGYQAAYNTAQNTDNVAIGDSALYNVGGFFTGGNNETALGFGALSNDVTGSNNTSLGYLANVGQDGLTNATAIGSNAIAMESNTLILGDSTSGVNVGIGTGSPTSTFTVAKGNVSLPVVVSAANVNLSTSPLTTTVIITATGHTVTLPSASSCVGRIYIIVAQMAAGSVTTSSYLDLTGTASTTVSSASSITIQSDGSNWDQIR